MSGRLKYQVTFCVFLFGLGGTLSFPLPCRAVDQKLLERLAPPARLPDLASPPAMAPAERGKSPLERLAPPAAPLPLAPHAPRPLVLPLEKLQTQRVWPAVDQPPLAGAQTPLLPPRPEAPTGPKAFVASADPQRLPPLDVSKGPLEAAPSVHDDLGAAANRELLVRPNFAAKPYPSQPLLLSTPDPFGHIPGVQLSAPPADNDPPAASRERGERPRMPVKTPPTGKQP